MDIASLLLGLALLLLVVFIVARPLVERHSLRERAPGHAEQLWFERERVLAALRDLDFDHATGKLLDADYTAPRAALVTQGVEILRQLDALGVVEPEPQSGKPGGAAVLDDEIEQAVARLRRQPAVDRTAGLAARDQGAAAVAPPPLPAAVPSDIAPLACAQCGRHAHPADRFCGKCGAALPRRCGQCGRVAQPADAFCAACGRQLAAVEAGE